MLTHNKPKDSIACLRAFITKTRIYLFYFYADFLLCFFELMNEWMTDPLIHNNKGEK